MCLFLYRNHHRGIIVPFAINLFSRAADICVCLLIFNWFQLLVSILKQTKFWWYSLDWCVSHRFLRRDIYFLPRTFEYLPSPAISSFAIDHFLSTSFGNTIITIRSPWSSHLTRQQKHLWSGGFLERCYRRIDIINIHRQVTYLVIDIVGYNIGLMLRSNVRRALGLHTIYPKNIKVNESKILLLQYMYIAHRIHLYALHESCILPSRHYMGLIILSTGVDLSKIFEDTWFRQLTITHYIIGVSMFCNVNK